MSEKWMAALGIMIVLVILSIPIAAIVRIASLPFSKRIRYQIKEHPLAHVFWLLLAALVFMLLFILSTD